MQGKIPFKHVRVGRVLHEDDNAVILEVVKNENQELVLHEGDQFWTIIFAHRCDNGVFLTWIPWEEENRDSLP